MQCWFHVSHIKDKFTAGGGGERRERVSVQGVVGIQTSIACHLRQGNAGLKWSGLADNSTTTFFGYVSNIWPADIP